jgi:Acyl-CoA dehydrogenase, C-terminal domain
MEADELTLLNETLLGLAESDADRVRLTAALDAFGWRDVLAAHPEEAITALFGAQGRTGTWSAALHDVLASHVEVLGITDPVTVVLPRPNRALPGTSHGGRATVDGVLLGPRHDATPFVLAVGSPGGGQLVIAVEPKELRVEDRHGLDPGLGAAAVSGNPERTRVLAEGDAADVWWDAAQSRGRLALCAQMVATLFVLIEQARSHVSERAQFGRLVGTFQAVRHKLVEAYVAATAADCSTAAAWESDDLSLAAATAKVVTGKAVATTAAHTQQLLAGIGFTSEHPYHRFMKRAIVLERMLGSATELTPKVGRRLMERGDAPRLVQL